MGWIDDIALSCRVCRIVSGIISTRSIMVNRMIAMPKLSKNTLYSSARLLIIGWMMMKFQMSPIISTV